MLTGNPNPDCTSTEADMLALGLKPLSADALAAKIVGKIAYGDFGYMFKYVMAVDEAGTLEGKTMRARTRLATGRLPRRAKCLWNGKRAGWRQPRGFMRRLAA